MTYPGGPVEVAPGRGRPSAAGSRDLALGARRPSSALHQAVEPALPCVAGSRRPPRPPWPAPWAGGPPLFLLACQNRRHRSDLLARVEAHNPHTGGISPLARDVSRG